MEEKATIDCGMLNCSLPFSVLIILSNSSGFVGKREVGFNPVPVETTQVNNTNGIEDLNRDIGVGKLFSIPSVRSTFIPDAFPPSVAVLQKRLKYKWNLSVSKMMCEGDMVRVILTWRAYPGSGIYRLTWINENATDAHTSTVKYSRAKLLLETASIYMVQIQYNGEVLIRGQELSPLQRITTTASCQVNSKEEKLAVDVLVYAFSGLTLMLSVCFLLTLCRRLNLKYKLDDLEKK